MHVAIVIDCYYEKSNGTSISARNCVRELLKRGIEVTVLCATSQNGEKVGDERIVEFDVLKIPCYQKTIEKQHALLANPNDGRICKAFKGVDIVHVFLPFFLGTHCMRIAHLLSIPVLGCYHMSAQNITYNAHMKYLLGSAHLTYDILKRVHYNKGTVHDIFCPSRYIARVLLAHGYRQNLHIISNGYDPIFKKLSTSYENDDNRYVISCVGRLTKEKRQDLIIRAVAKSKFRDKIDLYFAGKGPKYDSYMRLAKRLGVNLKIVYLDRQELLTLLDRSYLFIQASDVETEGIACLEAIACGVVPIISNAPMCATQQFAICKNSLFRCGNAKNLSQQIDYWINHKCERHRMSFEYAEFAKKFSLDRHVDSLITVYESIIKRTGKNQYIVRDYNDDLKFEFSCNDDQKDLEPTRFMTRKLSRLLRYCLRR